jgi:CubicO group peptidase (beta-lactamase class C family)
MKISDRLVFLLLILGLCSSCGSLFKYRKAGLPSENDYKFFANRRIESGTEPFRFQTAGKDFNLGQTIELDSRKIDASDETLEKFLIAHRTLSFLIIRNDTILYQYFDHSLKDSSIVTSFSVAKAFVSALVGIAISEGKIPDKNTSIVSYFPELANQGFEPVTIEHLLDHTSGIHFKESKNHVGGALEFYWGNNLSKDIFNIHPVFPPGEHFEYSNINSQLLGLILERATGMKLSQYLQEKIWKPIGMEYPASWSLSNYRADGIEKAFCCLNARTVDFAKFGRLYLKKGNWNGTQIIPEEWIDTTLHSSKAAGQRLTYHYNWGIGPKKYGSFYAIGLYGQFIYVYPEKNVIIVRFGKSDTGYNPPFLYQTMLQICDQL